MVRRLRLKRLAALTLRSHIVLPNLSAGYALLKGDSYALLTRLPLAGKISKLIYPLPFDLHV
jgi:hypothetical protein